MNPKSKNVFWFILFVLFLAVAYYAYNTLSDDFQTKQELQLKEELSEQDKTIAAPEFTVFDKQGKQISMSDFKGKPIVVNFWASWCPPCRREMPYFNEAYAEVGADVVFMMVDLVDGQRETQTKGQAFVKAQAYKFPVYFDNEQSAAVSYGITSIPTTYFINSEGNIVTAYQGAIDKDTLQAGIDLARQ